MMTSYLFDTVYGKLTDKSPWKIFPIFPGSQLAPLDEAPWHHSSPRHHAASVMDHLGWLTCWIEMEL